MLVSGILSSSFSNYDAQNVQGKRQDFQHEFQQLGTDLQAGNTTAAQQDYANMQQAAQSQGAQMHPHHHHHGGSNQENVVSQMFQQLGQDLQSGQLSAAQQAYGSLQTDLQQFTAQAITSSPGGVSFRA